jgi:hypothetical protein
MFCESPYAISYVLMLFTITMSDVTKRDKSLPHLNRCYYYTTLILLMVEMSPKRWISTEPVIVKYFSAMNYCHTEFKSGRIHQI